MAAATVGLWLGRGDRSARDVVIAPRSDRNLLAPYVVAGTASDEVATTLLAGRFATLEARPGQLVRATVDGDRDQRIAIVGPARLGIGQDVDAPALELAEGTLLVDIRDPRVAPRHACSPTSTSAATHAARS